MTLCTLKGLGAVIFGAAVMAAPAFASDLTVLHVLNGPTEGQNPFGRAVQDPQGNLYVISSEGAQLCPPLNEGCGAVIRIAPDGTAVPIVTFNGANGYASNTPLTLVGTRLYGATSNNYPAPGYGLLFSVNTDGTQFRILHQFTGYDGYEPTGTLRVAANGTVFGTTFAGGSKFGSVDDPYGVGVLFQLDPDGTYKVLHNFVDQEVHGVFSEHPSSILLAPDGTIYGATGGFQGKNTPFGGTLYRYAPATGIFTTLVQFKPKTMGNSPLLSGFVSSTTLYGTTSRGGVNNAGTLFTASASGITVLHDFAGTAADGGGPGGATMTADGTIVGVAGTGLEYGYGTVWSYGAGVFTTLISFPINSTLGPTYPDGVLARADGTLVVTSGGYTLDPAKLSPCYFANGELGSDLGCGSVFILRP